MRSNILSAAKIAAILSATTSGTAIAASNSVVYAFAGGNDGSGAVAGVTLGAGGTLYGVTVGGGSTNLGIVYQLTP